MNNIELKMQALRELAEVAGKAIASHCEDEKERGRILSDALLKVETIAANALGKEFVEVFGIEWDVDDAEADLPVCAVVLVDKGASDDDIIDALSDQYGWLVKRVESIVRHGDGD